jgi:hypothetical protein
MFFAAACMHKIKYFAFCTKDVDLENQTINGTFWEDGEFVKKITPFPTLFDFRLGNTLDRKNPEVYQVSRHGIGDKFSNAKWLLEGKFADFVIESQSYADCSIKEFLNKHKTIILKPSGGSNGEGIYKIEKKRGYTVSVHYLADKTTQSLDEFIEQNHAMFIENKYMVQAFINSSTVDGVPMDVRLNVARGKNGIWETSFLYIRLGSGNYLGTNMGTEQRSSTNAVLPSLKYQFGEEEGKRIHNEIKNFAKTFPNFFQRKVKFTLPEMALDIGIDRNNGNCLKLFEVGIGPGATSIKFSVIPNINVQFYKYLIEQKFSKDKKQNPPDNL